MSKIDRSMCPSGRHGTVVAYKNHGCRCPDARESYRLYRKRHREGRQPAALVPAIGVRRRLQALMAIGWTQAEIGRRLGWKCHKSFWLAMNADRVHRRTHNAVAKVYDELCMIPGPSAITRGKAIASGYRPPLAWNDIDRDPEPPAVEPDADADQVDPIAVARAVAGEPPAILRDVDRLAAVAELVRRGETTTQIADKLAVDYGQAYRDRDTIRARQRRNQTAKHPNTRLAVQSSGARPGDLQQSA